MSDDRLHELLDANCIAVVGCSGTPGKDAHEIPQYLQEHGYDVLPVNPYADEIFGHETYDQLSDIDEVIDLVTVFRPSDEIPGIVDQVLTRRQQRGPDDPAGLWLQLGISNDTAITRARDAEMTIVQDRCMKIEHGRLLESK